MPRLNSYEKAAQREVQVWLRGEASLLARVMDRVMRPVDWVVEQGVPGTVVDQISNAIGIFLGHLNDVSKWGLDLSAILKSAQRKGLEADRMEDLRHASLEKLDELSQSLFSQNTVLAALSGGGAGLGGAVLIAADIPLLFMINFHLIQRIGAAYGFPMTSPECSPVVLSIYNAAAANSREARGSAMHEIGIAAAAMAGETPYQGRVRGTLPDQSRHLPRELAKNLVGRKLLQAVPLAGAAVGAGINYWFTRETAQTTYMLFRALYLEHKERLR